jgi:hypothetical protein
VPSAKVLRMPDVTLDVRQGAGIPNPGFRELLLPAHSSQESWRLRACGHMAEASEGQ